MSIITTKQRGVVMTSLSIRAIGSSSGVVLPKEVLNVLGLKRGDKVYVVKTANGIELSKYDPEFARDMALISDIINKNRNLLKRLADS